MAEVDTANLEQLIDQGLNIENHELDLKEQELDDENSLP